MLRDYQDLAILELGLAHTAGGKSNFSERALSEWIVASVDIG
jgi:hypothetical protein